MVTCIVGADVTRRWVQRENSIDYSAIENGIDREKLKCDFSFIAGQSDHDSYSEWASMLEGISQKVLFKGTFNL